LQAQPRSHEPPTFRARKADRRAGARAARGALPDRFGQGEIVRKLRASGRPVVHSMAMPAPPSWTADRAVDALLEALAESVLAFAAASCRRRAGRAVGEIFGFDPRGALGIPRRELLGRLASSVSDPTGLLAALSDESLEGESTVLDPVIVDRPHPRVV